MHGSAILIAGLTFAGVAAGALAAQEVVRRLRGGLDPELEARLRELERPHDEARSRVSIVREAMRSEIPAVDRWLRGLKLTGQVERFLMQSGSGMAAGELVLIMALAGGAGFAAACFAGGLAWVAALPAAALGAGVPPLWLAIRRDRRLRRIGEQLPEALDLMASSLRAGHAYTAAIAVVAEELDEPIASEFQMMCDQYRVGLGQRECLKMLVDRVDIPDLRLFATAVLIQIETGGNLAEVFEKLAEVMRDRFKLAGQVRAITAEGRLSGAILGALPIVVGVIITILNPEYLKPLFHQPVGLLLIGCAIVLELAGFLWIRRIVEVRA